MQEPEHEQPAASPSAFQALLARRLVRATDHPGSKKGARHVNHTGADRPAFRAWGRMAAGQKCVPPVAKERAPLVPAVPMAAQTRAQHYFSRRYPGQDVPAQTTDILPYLTHNQRSRVMAKMTSYQRKALEGHAPQKVPSEPAEQPTGTWTIRPGGAAPAGGGKVSWGRKALEGLARAAGRGGKTPV